jgi:hypothetical protein
MWRPTASDFAKVKRAKPGPHRIELLQCRACSMTKPGYSQIINNR